MKTLKVGDEISAESLFENEYKVVCKFSSVFVWGKIDETGSHLLWDKTIGKIILIYPR